MKQLRTAARVARLIDELEAARKRIKALEGGLKYTQYELKTLAERRSFVTPELVASDLSAYIDNVLVKPQLASGLGLDA